MKIIMLAIVLALSITSSTAYPATFMHPSGIVFGNVCRNGLYFTVYPMAMAQPIGSPCLVRDVFGNPIMSGLVSFE